MSRYGDGRVYQRTGSKNLWVEYWFEGVQHRELTGADDTGLARVFLLKRIVEKRAASVGLAEFISPQRVMLEKLLDNLEDDYRINGRKSLSQLHYHLRTVRRRLRGLRAVELDSVRVRAYIRQRQEEEAKNATINRELAALRRALNLACQDGLLRQVSHFPKLPGRNVRKSFFEQEQAVAHAPSPPPRNVRPPQPPSSWRGHHRGPRRGGVCRP
jgi:hypothetical protein